MTTIRPGPIEQLVQDTLEPGDFQPGTYIRRPQNEVIDSEGNLTAEMPGMVVVDLQSAGWTYLYDTKTREASLCNNNAILAQLSCKREDGSLVFTRTKPSTPPWRGTYKCILHSESRGALPEDLQASFRFCSKANIPNEHEVMMHMQHRHRNEWLAIERAREERERREDREIQRQMAEALTGRVMPGQSYLPIEPEPSVKRVRTPEQIEADKAKMAKVRAGKQ
jgi:hypothetical protein